VTYQNDLEGRTVAEIDTFAILREIYGGNLGPHYDLYERSIAHREEHGEGCTVYPSDPADAPIWPLLTRMVDARRFLEVGCGLGYTAALMAEAGGPSCRVDTIEALPEHADLAEAELSERGLGDRVQVLRGEARDILPGLRQTYDIIFVDAEWNEYPQFLPYFLRLTRPGGLLVSANLFPLFEEWARDMPHKEAVQEYLTLLVRESGFLTHIIPGKWHALSLRV
jgi:predicted O-methyltransferase YrrM